MIGSISTKNQYIETLEKVLKLNQDKTVYSYIDVINIVEDYGIGCKGSCRTCICSNFVCDLCVHLLFNTCSLSYPCIENKTYDAVFDSRLVKSACEDTIRAIYNRICYLDNLHKTFLEHCLNNYGEFRPIIIINNSIYQIVDSTHVINLGYLKISGRHHAMHIREFSDADYVELLPFMSDHKNYVRSVVVDDNILNVYNGKDVVKTVRLCNMEYVNNLYQDILKSMQYETLLEAKND